MPATTRDRINQIAIFMIALVCYAYFFPRWADQNQNSRLNMVIAAVDDGTFQIDRFVKDTTTRNTVDYAKVGDHYYSDKAPGVAFLGIPLYAGFRLVLNLPMVDQMTERLAKSEAFQATLREGGSGVAKDKVRYALTQTLLAFLTNAVPTALLCALIYALLRRMGAGMFTGAFVALAYGLLTPAFAYANAFYGHQLSAVLLFAAFCIVFWGSQPGAQPPSGVALFGAGLMLGFSVVTEYPAALVAGIVTLYAVWMVFKQGAWSRIVALAAGLAVCAAGLMIYNTAVFGGPFKLGYGNSELWTAEHSVGFMSLTVPHADAALGMTFGLFRGLFVLSPLTLLAVPGFMLWWRSGRQRTAFWVALCSTLSMFVFNASSIMWWGGFGIGPRYFLPGLPFMMLALAFVVDPTLRRSGADASNAPTRNPAWLIAATGAFAVWSLVATWGLTLAEQAFPPDTLYNPLLEYAVPNWAIGNIARNMGTLLGLKSFPSLLPLVAVVAGLAVIWWMLARRTDRPNAAAAERAAKLEVINLGH